MDQPISDKTINRRRRLQLVAAVGLLASLSAAAWGVNRAVRPSMAASDIVVAEVRRGNIANTVSAAGVVIPVHEELVTSPIQTRVAKVHAKLGQSVKAGELLLELDSQALRLAADSFREQLAQQENRILGMTLEMEQKRKQLVSNIELLALDLQSARVKWERYQTLRKSGAVSGEDMLTAELNVKRREIELRQQRELIDDNRRATSSSIEGARLQKAILQKQMAQQQQLLDQTQVRAPFAGMLSSLMAEEGASVAMGQLVAKVSELSNYRVEASVSDFHANILNPGQLVRVEQGGHLLPGKVHTILPEIQNGSIKLIVHLDQPSHPMLRNKMRVDVNIVTEEKSGTLVSDNGPAFNGKGRQNVFVLRDGVAHRTVLEIGNGDGKAVEIVSGAKAGERLIVSGMARHKDQDSVRITK
ncbi:efflux RND transporter periplasmic adaptor subunit [Massilia glaciei]|uniref:ABC transporter permease n=1 Tax=Massilia glaciei TaxID=1524097 RepID=A0A2U2HLR1_9BURK|nr:HlyD family efflux transporter periplasmic adaptor subunit [Massilia glaciei]PWF48433.1 ABC transporter permease [Massilia glaciei]